jgi:ATP synthase, F1 gamma subunit
MASLKEIRARISSVISTQKITSAMKMVSAAKLKKTESAITQFLPYKNKLSESLSNYLSTLDEKVNIPLAENRQVVKVALVVFSSNSGLCGVFNSNIIKLFNSIYSDYCEKIGKENILIYVVGKKIHDHIKKLNLPIEQSYDELCEKPTYSMSTSISDLFISMFLEHKIDKVELLYNHFKNTGLQIPTSEVLLPLEANTIETDVRKNIIYIVEPSKEVFVNELVPKVIRTRMYASMMDSVTAEHGARTTAMQIASENAGELLQDLRLQYNKVRQEVITNEILDIVGGAEALNKN